jgi:hypothetical protein
MSIQMSGDTEIFRNIIAQAHLIEVSSIYFLE